MSYRLIDENVQPACKAKNAYRRFPQVMTGHRSYQPETGRWISRDPLGEMGGKHLYCLLRNTGINKYDPIGLAESCCKQEDIDLAGYVASVAAQEKTKDDEAWPQREFCGLLCCDKKNFSVIAVGMHPGPVPQGLDKATCDPRKEEVREQIGRGVIIRSWKYYKCPDGSNEVGIFHSHPRSFDFSEADKDQGECVYMGAPNGKVYVWCPDPSNPEGGTEREITFPPEIPPDPNTTGG